MGKKQFGEYYLGLDIGTESVGWAVTDLNYKLLKFNGKAMWGSRIFSQAETAAERRMHRTSRRRLQRRKQRIALLQELFAAEICKTDPGFFLRLQESNLWPEDKAENQANSLFNDENYTDKEFYQEFPTIYHLRQALIDGTKQYDIRLIYLALHNIIKYRGHFLLEGNISTIDSLEQTMKSLENELADELDINIHCMDIEKFGNILRNRAIGIDEKKKQLSEVFSFSNEDKSRTIKIINLLAGSKVNLADIFPDISLEQDKNEKIAFSNLNYEEEIAKLEPVLQDRIYLINKLKAIYDWGVLEDILNPTYLSDINRIERTDGKRYLSDAKVEIYEQHKYDLRILKRVIKRYIPEKYQEVFCAPDKKINYCSYIGSCRKNGRKTVVVREKSSQKKCTQEELCKYLIELLKTFSYPEDLELKHIIDAAESNTLLPKLTAKSNCVIPRQVHQLELEAILRNAARYYTFLNVPDAENITVKEKISQVFTFRIPYYIGPLNDAHQKEKDNCWVVRKSRERIYPWNFARVVDEAASAEKFITRMTNQCTQLADAAVLPKNSLLYSKFVVLNALNSLKIDDQSVTVELKQKIYNELFLNGSKNTVSYYDIKKYLQAEGITAKNSELSGLDIDFKASLLSERQFKKILGGSICNQEMIENIIRWIVIFGDAKKILQEQIVNHYGKILKGKQIEQILALKYQGWGRLSKEFLCDIYHVDKTTGECISIINALWNTNSNLMQLLSKQFDYLQRIEEHNAELTDVPDIRTIDYSVVEKLYVSPAVKRQIWQVLCIIKELSGILQHEPQKVFVEFARESGKKQRTVSRKEQLKYLYKSCKNEERDWLAEIEKLDEGELRQDKLYLYYLQMGKCMYTGDIIKLGELFDKNLYDIDHIYPQSKVKDDSLDNRVLVKKTDNLQKADIYPLNAETRNRMRSFWVVLRDKGLISKEKFYRLNRTTSFTDDELAGFINRQLVETRQSAKAVAELLRRVLKTDNVVYVKARTVSDFRDKFKIYKVREINDLHHAKDAYLNIVVGNVYDTKFTRDPQRYIRERKGETYNLKDLFKHDVIRANNVAWLAGDNETITTVKKTMAKNNALITHYAFAKTGKLFKVTIQKKQSMGKKKDGLHPVKLGWDVSKYGGYDLISVSYFMLVEHIKKKKKVISLIDVPIYLCRQNGELGAEAELKYCSDKGLSEPRILISKIKIQSLFKLNGCLYYLTGKSDATHVLMEGAEQLCLDRGDELYLKKVLKIRERIKENKGKNDHLLTQYDQISAEENIRLYNLFLEKLTKTVLQNHHPNIGKKLQSYKEKFAGLQLNEQIVTLYEILKYLTKNKTGANLSLIGGGEKAETRIKLSANISGYNDAKIIYQSTTGLFSQEVDLLTL